MGCGVSSLPIFVKRTFDADIVRDLISRDKLSYFLSSDDGCPDVKDIDASPSVVNRRECYFIEAGNGCDVIGIFFFRRRNHIMVDAHVVIIKEHRGRCAVIAAKKAFDMMFGYGFMKIQAYIPEFNRPAYFFAKMAGMRDEGRSIKSFMKCGVLYDQFILGISAEDICPVS